MSVNCGCRRETRKIRVAVVGAGEFGRNHVRVYREMGGGGAVRECSTGMRGRAATIAQEFQTRAFQV